MNIRIYAVYDNQGSARVTDNLQEAIELFNDNIDYYVCFKQKMEMSDFDNDFTNAKNIMETLEKTSSFSMQIGNYFQVITSQTITI